MNPAMRVLLVAIAVNLILVSKAESASFVANANSKNPSADIIQIGFEPTTNGVKYSAVQGGVTLLSGLLNVGEDVKNVTCIGASTCQIGDYSVSIQGLDGGMKITWETQNQNRQFRDCFDLEGSNWYGGPQRWKQDWPIEKLKIDGTLPYTVRRDDNSGIAERYWLNSKGGYIYLSEKTPLFVDQNNQSPNQVCFIAKLESPYINRQRNLLEYYIIYQANAKDAHLHAVNNYLGKPTGHPDEGMIKEPIWTTWAKYKKDINDATVLEFAQTIRDHGYVNGQLEIDDNWEPCYGAQVFTTDKFADIANTVAKLKSMNFRVTLWIHPFVNNDCQNNSNIGVDRDYFVKNSQGATTATWWNGNDAHQIDFTKPEAAEWFSARVRGLQQNPGIDSFKFDAGETDYGTQPSVYDNVDQELVPNILTQSYIRTIAKFGNLIEARSASRTQDLPFFTRMLDKDSVWTDSNGLYTVVTTLLQMNMNGYGMVLPDMIGGNGYSGETPSAELIVRWTQANTFMPTMQFSYLPWEITSDQFDAPGIVKKFVELHATYSDKIVAAMQASIIAGTPVNAPIWWVDPTDSAALAIDDEFLLGETILVAPILWEGATSRNVYLPQGDWLDANTNTIYTGPIMINDYPAPIEVLPYFIKN